MSLANVLRAMNADRKVKNIVPSKPSFSDGATISGVKRKVTFSGDSMDLSSVETMVKTAEKRSMRYSDAESKESAGKFDVSPESALEALSLFHDTTAQNRSRAEYDQMKAAEEKSAGIPADAE